MLERHHAVWLFRVAFAVTAVLSPLAAQQATQTIQGDFYVVINDHFDRGTSDQSYWIRTPQGDLELVFSDPAQSARIPL
jgi:hypothetical protein